MTEDVLSALRRRANHRGQIVVRETVLLKELHIGTDELRRTVKELEERHVLEVLAPPPFLVAKLSKSWPGEREKAAEVPPAYSFQSSLSESQQLMKESYRQPSEDEALLNEILETLGEHDATTFRGAITSYPAGIIRTTLSRIRRMKNIRKNRTALFRFLLPRIAKESPSTK